MAARTLASTGDWAKLVATVVDDKLRFAKTFLEAEAQQPELRDLLAEADSSEKRVSRRIWNICTGERGPSVSSRPSS